MLRIKHQAGFASLMEVIVTAIIFFIAATGIFTTISMLRPHGVDSAKRLKAVYAGKQILDELRGKVSALTWNNASGDLYPGNYNSTVTNDNISYNIDYEIKNASLSDIREVTMNIEY